MRKQAKKSQGYKVAKSQIIAVSLILCFFLSTLYSLLSTSFSYGDEIKIRTIVTPIGSQSEKWGAAGLMVCVVGDDIPQGGCGAGVNGGFRIQPGTTATKEEITGLEDGTLIIFKDTSDGSGAGENHQYDYQSGWDTYSDTIYEVRGSGGGIPGGFCIFSDTEANCPSGWTRRAAFDSRTIRGASVPGGTGGANSHTHSLSCPGTHNAIGGTAGQTVYTCTDSQFNWPPYMDVIICCKD